MDEPDVRMASRTRDKRGSVTGHSIARPRVVVAQTRANNKFSLLTVTLKQSDFWPLLEESRRRAEVSAENFSILIKPDLELFNPGDPTGTDPELVEHLIDLLHDRGYTRVVVGDARNVWSLWLENRDVAVLAELVGYHYVTPKGRAYDIVDLSEEVVPVPFPPESALHGTGLGRAWVEAQYRINFAKNKTHEEFRFALCLHNLLGVLPLRDKGYHYRHRLKPWELCVAVHRQTPAHFNLIDAFISNHGSEGSRIAHPLETHALIAGNDALLVDWAASLKMGADPYASPLNAKALREVGLPLRYDIVGDLSPYPGWINPSPMLMDSVRKREESPGLSRLVKPWLQSINRELFPFKHLVNDRINAVASEYLSHLDSNNAAFWMFIGLNYLLAYAHRGLEAYQTSYNKERLLWREAPLDFEPSAFQLADYEAVVDYLEPLHRIIRETPPEPSGLRWRYLDGSVLFEFSHLTPVPFEQFVARVDIARAVQSMNDYIGGACVPVARNRAGKVVYQAERNIYLPQPNWLAFFGGKPIDVGKLEYIRYGRREQKIFWRTIKSSNGSAEFDDGIVTFAAESKNQTRVTIVARQKFTLPIFWQVVNVDLTPKIKDFLVIDAYTRYFRQTIANFESQYQGREFRIGRPWDPTAGEDNAVPNTQLETIIDILTTLGKALANNVGDLSGLLRLLGLEPKQNDFGKVDAEGFRHFTSQPPGSAQARGGFTLSSVFQNARGEAATFFADLADAVRKDAGLPSQGAGVGLSE